MLWVGIFPSVCERRDREHVLWAGIFPSVCKYREHVLGREFFHQCVSVERACARALGGIFPSVCESRDRAHVLWAGIFP